MQFSDKGTISILTSVYANSDYATTDTFLWAITNQIIPSQYRIEFLICNDGVTERVATLLTNYKDQYSTEQFQVKLIHNDGHKGIPYSLNQLWRSSTGHLVVFIDADAIPCAAEWLKNVTEPLIVKQAMVAQGNFWRQYNGTTWLANQHEGWRKATYLSRFQNSHGTLKTLNTRNVAIQRDVLIALVDSSGDLFLSEAACGADTTLGFMVVKRGFVINLVPNAAVGHCDPVSFMGILKQKIRHGYHDGKIGICIPIVCIMQRGFRTAAKEFLCAFLFRLCYCLH